MDERRRRTRSTAGLLTTMVLGEPDGGAGSLLAHLLGPESLMEHPEKLSRLAVVDDHEFCLELYTNLGFGRLCGVADSAARSAQAFAFVFDVSKRHTYLAFETWREWLAQIRPDLESVPVLLLGLCPAQVSLPVLDTSTSSSSSSTHSGGSPIAAPLNGVSPSISPRRMVPSDGSADSGSTTPSTQIPTSIALRSVDGNEASQLAEAYGCRYREVTLPSNWSTNGSPGALSSQEQDHVLEPFLSLIRSVHRDGRSALSSDTSSAAAATTKAVDLTLVGDSFVGKTAILERVTASRFVSKYVSTTEPRLVKHRMGVDGTLYLLRLRDTCGWAGEEGLGREHVILTHGILLVFDLTNAQSLQTLHLYHDYISSIKQDKKVAYVLVGAKSDLVNDDSGLLVSRAVSEQQAKALAKEWNCPYVEFSAKDGDALDLLRVAVRQVRYVFDESSASALPLSMSAFLQVKAPSSSKFKRKFVQFQDGKLCWWKDEPASPESAMASLRPKHCLDVSVDALISAPTAESGEAASKWGFSVSIKVGKKTLTLATPSPSERDAWVAALLSSVSVQKVANSLLDEFVRETVRELRELVGSSSQTAASPTIDSLLQKRLSKTKE